MFETDSWSRLGQHRPWPFLYALQCVTTHIGDTAESSDGSSTVQILFAGHVLRQAWRHYDDVFGKRRQLFDAQINHSAEDGVFWLEEFSHGEKCFCSFGGAELLSLEHNDQYADL